MESAPLHNAIKASAAEVNYSQEALYQMLYTLHYISMHLNRYRDFNGCLTVISPAERSIKAATPAMSEAWGGQNMRLQYVV